MCFPHGMAVLIKKNSFYFRSPLPMTFLSMPTLKLRIPCWSAQSWGWILHMTFLSIPASEDPMLKCPELRMNLTYDFLEHAGPWGSHVEVPRVENESYLWLSWACRPLRIPCWSARSWGCSSRPWTLRRPPRWRSPKGQACCRRTLHTLKSVQILLRDVMSQASSLVVGSLESTNSSILAACSLF